MKIKFYFVIFLLAQSYITNAQKAYVVNDFLKGYTLYFAKQTKNSKTEEYYRLTENQTKKTVLEYGSKQLSKSELSKTAKITTFKSIPESNIRVLGDVNFDGRTDVIIFNNEKNDDEGCYTPQATAYIFINMSDSFVLSNSISDLYYNSFCVRGGGFEIDAKNKRLITSSSGGAALHVCSYYSVSGLEAKEECTFEEDGYSFPFLKITGKKRKGNDFIPFSTLSVYEPNLEKVVSFDTKNGKGRIILFKHNGILYYAFRQNDEYKFVSFAHPSSPEKADKAGFKFRKQNTAYELEFNSGSIKYIIYESATDIGIKIYVNGKLSDWQGTSKKGSLSLLSNTTFKNMVKE
ncbi:XAC2610-related protein [Flavobacterium sp. MMS24-S5]|uniref:XAC2610-related protein n=1 Tax=Flavobacterium sp. MMS24-S5 TaxID=3416605 RepID=UPI003D0660A7